MGPAANELSAPFERLLADVCTPAIVRQIEGGGSTDTLWEAIGASGFLDALVLESTGGAGLSLAEAFPLFMSEGRHALPLPLAHTMLVRAVLAQEGRSAPAGPTSIATTALFSANGAISCPGTPWGLVAEWVAVTRPAGWLLLPTASATRSASGVHGSLRADLAWPALPAAAQVLTHPAAWLDVGAAVTAALLAGAMDRVLEMTVAHANQREQFGRSIGKFQAIQHQLAVMAEQAAASRMAAQMGCSGNGPWPQPLRAALAKARTSEAAALVAATAHAVHGAIGVTAEFDLQLYTRRLHEWRADFGAETHWNRVLGRALLATDAASTLDFMRHTLFPPHQDL